MTPLNLPVTTVAENKCDTLIEGNDIRFIPSAYPSEEKRRLNHKLLEATIPNFKKSLLEKIGKK